MNIEFQVFNYINTLVYDSIQRPIYHSVANQYRKRDGGDMLDQIRDQMHEKLYNQMDPIRTQTRGNLL